jgi:acyl-coenzyme A thioesterase PaaI-like protein
MKNGRKWCRTIPLDSLTANGYKAGGTHREEAIIQQKEKLQEIRMNVKVTGKQPNARMCFVCGTQNRFGLKSRFYELENGDTVALFQPAEEHQGYPGRLHGGLAATILDETIGRAIMALYPDNIWGVTVDFAMNLRKPVPLDREVKVVARITKDGKRFFEGSGEIVLEDGTVAISGKGRYLKMPIDKIADLDVDGGDWQVVQEANDPAAIDLPPKASAQD